MSKEGKKLRAAIMKRLPEINNEEVLKSMGLVMGDYVVRNDGAERADIIFPIIFQIVSNAEVKDLRMIYSFSRGLLAERAVTA